MKTLLSLLSLLIATPTQVFAQTKTVDGASLPRLSLSKPAEHGGVYNHAFTPDGKKLAALTWIVRGASNGGAKEKLAGGEIFLLDTRKGSISRVLGSHDQNPIWLRFTEDGKTLGSYSDDDHTLKLWKTTGKKPKAVIDLGGPCGLNSSPRMSANGETLVHLVHRKLPIGERGLLTGHTLTGWDLKKKRQSWSISAEGPMGELSAKYGVSPDGDKVAVYIRHVEWREENGRGRGTNGETYHAVLNAKTGEELWRVDGGNAVRTAPGKQVLFSPDGTEVLTAGNTWIHRYDAATGEPLGEKIGVKQEDSLREVFFSEDGDRLLVTRFFGKQLDVYAFPSGEHELAVMFDDSAKFTHACPTGDLKKVAGRVGFDAVVLDLSKALKK